MSVPANYTAQLSVVFYKYNMDVDYVATCVGVTSGRRIKIKGKWSGVDAQFVDAVLNLTPIDSSTASSRKIIITKQMLDSGKIIKVDLKSASNLNGNLNCSKELEHYAS